MGEPPRCAVEEHAIRTLEVPILLLAGEHRREAGSVELHSFGPQDPRDAMVRCSMGGRMMRFTSRIDCEGRGGTVLGEVGLPADDA